MDQTSERDALVKAIVERLARQHTTAMVLFHHAVAERLRLGPTDHKCLDLLREREALTGSELAGLTGLTTGAVTGVVARLEKAGYLRREPDPWDRRKQVLRPVPERVEEIHRVITPLRAEVAELLDRFDAHQLAAIADFLSGTAEIGHRQAAVLRAESLTRTHNRSEP
ncbi:DNA-binding MarR family transcriptional regulator [Pseudonocardia eucalypti]|nr:DNA-binding MarR family transcriptional regulator [Pseudonocardia eucalypti]